MSENIALNGKRIVLGVSGSIAAYKAADLVRRLGDAGAEVRVVMTKGACEFITPLTLQTLSGHPVALELLDADQESAMGHIALARWADWVVVAPASADFIARFAQGRADDLLAALCLATEKPVAVAPAMNNKMWSNSATQNNLAVLRERGTHILGPASGDQACGEVGEGRLLEPSDIVSLLQQLVLPPLLQGLKVLVTAGPTHEAIDPVRYIANRSSGKMGYALAQAAVEAGASVQLVSGPVSLATPTGVHRTDVESAQQMFDAVMSMATESDIFISCAAVADYTPVVSAEHKLKKAADESLSLQLMQTKDIVSAVANLSEAKPFVVGFAAETQAVESYAQDKLQRKGLDMIAANDVSDGKVFGQDQNALDVFWQGGQCVLPKQDKTSLARALTKLIAEQFNAKNTTENS
jgi:phosphopantothenoylcysteine decarboxylase/phosphopantothenate--cysteine ligase